MRHRRRYFPGKGIFWIFILIFLFGGMGKSGFPGIFVPLMIFWFIGPLVFSATRQSKKRAFRPEPARATTPAAGPRPQPKAASFRQMPVRSLEGIPAVCRSCGGPANETTVEWRGSRAVCGFCGTAFL